MTAPDPAKALAEERARDLVAPIDAAFARGEITQAEWHRRILGIVMRRWAAPAPSWTTSGARTA